MSTTTETQTATIPAGCKLSRVASKDKTRPVLTGCGFQLIDGTLYAVTTDSYALAAIEVQGGSEEWHGAIIPMEALKAWEGTKKYRPTLTISDGNVHVVGEEKAPGYGRNTWSLIPGTFPNVAALIGSTEAKADNPDAISAIGVNPTLLANVQAAFAKNNVRLSFTSPLRGIRVTPLEALDTTRPDAIGLVMPIRLRD